MEFVIYKEELLIDCEEVIELLEKSLSRISVGSANPQMFSSLKIMYYDSLTPIGDLCSITHPEAQQLLIKPFDKELVKDINSLIIKQNFSITIQDEGDKLRIIFPQLTTEKRKESVKQLSVVKEQSKIKLRNVRHNILKKIKMDDNLSEDIEKNFQEQVQKIINTYSEKIDNIVKQKEDQLMKL